MSDHKLLTQVATVQELDNTQKYGNDYLFESPFDTYVFVPLGEKLVDPAYLLNLTPNALTILSTVFELFAVLFLVNDLLLLSVMSYIIGYIFDCSDGKMARKYKMCTEIGCVLDFNTDMIVHSILYGVFFYKYILNMNLTVLLSLGIMTVFCHYYYGLAQAYLFKNKKNNDNFYDEYCKIYEHHDNWFYKVFLKIHKNVYDSYKKIMPEYNETKLLKIMNIMHYFGPGSYVVFLSTIILFGGFNDYNIDKYVFNLLLDSNLYLLISVVFISSFLTFLTYETHGKNGNYKATEIVHYFGLALGLLFMYYSVQQKNSFMLAGATSLFSFHIKYDLESQMTQNLLAKQN